MHRPWISTSRLLAGRRAARPRAPSRCSGSARPPWRKAMRIASGLAVLRQVVAQHAVERGQHAPRARARAGPARRRRALGRERRRQRAQQRVDAAAHRARDAAHGLVDEPGDAARAPVGRPGQPRHAGDARVHGLHQIGEPRGGLRGQLRGPAQRPRVRGGLGGGGAVVVGFGWGGWRGTGHRGIEGSRGESVPAGHRRGVRRGVWHLLRTPRPCRTPIVSRFVRKTRDGVLSATRRRCQTPFTPSGTHHAAAQARLRML